METIIKIIRQVINENLDIIIETQKGKKIDTQKEKLLSNLSAFSVEGDINKGIIMKEVEREVEHKINKVLNSQYEYSKFYIVKLGNFILKNNDGVQPIVFNMDGFAKNFTFPYLYIYNDTVIVVKFGSRFFDTDQILTKDALDFIKKHDINLDKSDEILFDTTFDTENVIDLTDYSKLNQKEQKEKTPALAKEKSYYRVGSKINHPKFGGGLITKTKKHNTDEDGNTWYNVTVDFNGKEKTLRMKQK